MKRIIPYQVNIASLSEHRKALKNRPKKCQILQLNFNDGANLLSNRLDKQAHKWLVKLLKNVKPIIKLDIHKGLPYYKQNTAQNQFIQLAKIHSRIQILKTLYWHHSPAGLKLYCLWLKYTLNLVKFECIQSQLDILAFDIENKSRFENFQRLIRRNKKLTSLVLSPKSIFGGAPANIFQLKNYPSTLKKLYFDVQPSGDVFMEKESLCNICFSPMKILQDLTLILPNITELWTAIFETFPGENQIQALQLGFTESSTEELTVPSEWLKKMKNLHHIQFSFYTQPLGLGELLTQLHRFKELKSFHLSIEKLTEDNSFDLSLLTNCLANFIDIQNLTLKLHQNWSTELSMEFLQNLTSQIATFSQLQRLKLHFHQVSSSDHRRGKAHCIDLNTNGLFDHLKNIKEFSFVSNFASQDMFHNFLQALNSNASQLKKLKLDVGDFRPSKNFFSDFHHFLQEMKHIQVLNFPNLNITNAKIFEETTEIICSLGSLRKLNLGVITKSISNKVLLQVLSRIFALKHLKKLALKAFPIPKFQTPAGVAEFKTLFNHTIQRNPELNAWNMYWHLLCIRKKSKFARSWNDSSPY